MAKYRGKLEQKKFKKSVKIVEQDSYYTDMMNSKGLAIATQKRYKFSLATYVYFCEQTLTELLTEADEEEEKAVRLNKRKIRNRLITFRSFLDSNFSNSTVKQRFQDVKQFYKFWGIERPDLPNQVLRREEHVDFADLPTKEMIKQAIEGTSNLKHIAILLFSFSTGSGRAEIGSTKVRAFIEGTKDYHNNNGNIEDMLEQLSKRKDIIPVIKMHRLKTDRDYYTCCTPECASAIVRYLRTRENLSLDDKLFDISLAGISHLYCFISDKHNWGYVKSYRRFTSHKLRKLNATLIEDVAFANTIQGRQSDTITETYFFKNPERIRERYVEYIPLLTINEVVNIEYGKEKIEELNAEIEKREAMIAKMDKTLQDFAQQQNEMTQRLTNLEDRNSDQYMPRFDETVELDEEMYTALDKYIQENDLGITPGHETYVLEWAYNEYIGNVARYDGGAESLSALVKKGKLMNKLHPEIREQIDKEYEQMMKGMDTCIRIKNLIINKAEELELFDNAEMKEFEKKVFQHVYENRMKYIGRYLDHDEIVLLIQKIV